jgi:L-ascorbate metabolism protein UlaG (beta-lactamase superfamily)
MSADISIRAYVVGFGDCILLKLPDGDQTRYVLVDFGRAPNDPSSVERFPAIAADIAKQCKGHLDLIVVTHEHLDHMEGFYRERAVFDKMQVDQVWMGLPSHPDYYKNYPKARLEKKIRAAVGEFAHNAARNGLTLHPAFRSLLENNLANVDRINYLRKLGKKPPVYLARGKYGKPATKWSQSIHIEVLAPEEDTSVYYGKSAAMHAMGAALAAATGVSPVPDSDADFDWEFKSVPRARPGDLPGISQSDFDRLRNAIREDGVGAARFIDHAQNNTSLCLVMEVAGKRLMLPGDAELESWANMHEHAELKPVDFLKVSHHGSHNGTPMDLLDTLLPKSRAAKAKVLVSTKKNVYGTKNPVPDSDVITELKKRCSELVSTDGLTGTYVELHL